ncbi:MAG TPA: CHAT domain-containing protein [Dermatophilaceae bacterium]|nr:CHAT domain-containing protein [Dermatophilaceae bacterium]
MLDPVVTLDAALTVRQVQEALRGLPPDQVVAIRRRHPDGSATLLWYAAPVGELIRVAGLAPADQPLGRALDLHEHQAGQTRGPADDLGSFTGLVVRGGRALGYARPSDRVVRGMDPVVPGAGAVPPRHTTRTSTCYPRLRVPAEVAPAERFEIDIGLADQPETATDAPMAVPTPRRRGVLTLEVQVVADGFTAPDGTRHPLLAPRDRLTSTSVRVALIAPTVTDVWRGRIEVSYAVSGTVVGRAWRDVVVRPAGATSTALSTSGGSVPIAEPKGAAVDLTVSVVEGVTPGRVWWTFTSPHPGLPLPTGQVSTDLPAGSSQAFAVQVLGRLGAADGTAMAGPRLAGVSRAIARATPVELWQALGAVWRIAHAAGRLPSVLLVSDETDVPWELASTEKQWVPERSLVDETAPQLLGAQVSLGRWAPAGPNTPSGDTRPAPDPEPGIEVSLLAVVVGDYSSTIGVRPLPSATAEGDALAAAYPSVRLAGTLPELTRVLNGRVEHAGAPAMPEVVHVAAHGEVDLLHPRLNGIVLSDTAERLDELAVLGGDLAESGAPLVFLNACQLAMSSTDLLGDQGGLAGAFLTIGARAFVSPLWSVDDVLAQQTALEFYRHTLADGLTVGEALRRLRAAAGAVGATTETTPLAYVYYGHPDLRLTLTG